MIFSRKKGKETVTEDRDTKQENLRKQKMIEQKKRNNKINQDISQVMPFTYDDDKKLFKTLEGEYIKMVLIHGTNIFGFNDEEQLGYMEAMESAFNPIVGDGQIYSYEESLDVDQYMDDIEYLKSNLNPSNIHDQLKFDILLKEQSRLKNEISDYSLTDRRFLYILKDKSLKNLNERIEDVRIRFQQYNRPRILSTQEMIEVIYNYYNPAKSRMYEAFKDEITDGDVMDFIKPTYCGFVNTGYKTSVELDDVTVRCLFVSSYIKKPVSCLLQWLSTYPNVDFSLHFEKAPSDSIQKELDKTLKTLADNYEKEREHSKKAEIRQRYNDVQEMSDDVLLNGGEPYYFTVAVRLKAPDEDIMRMMIHDFKQDVQRFVRVEDGVYEPIELMNTVAPICINQCPAYAKTTTSSTISWMYPLVYDNLFDRVPLKNSSVDAYMPAIYIGNTLGKGGAVFYDNFVGQDDRSNYNEFFVGNSGMGKTFTLMLFAYYRHARGYKQYSIDVEGKEFPKLTRYIHGNNIDCTDGARGRINPLQIRFNIPDEDERSDEITTNTKISLSEIYPLNDHLRFITQFLIAYIGDPNHFTKEHQVAIEIALTRVYQRVGITSETSAQWIVDHLKNQDYPIFKDLYDELDEEIHKEQVKQSPDNIQIAILKKCMTYIYDLALGHDSTVFNGTTNVNLDNSFINFNISGLQTNTASTVLKAQYFNILSYIWNDIMSDTEGKRKQIYADEISTIMDPRFKDVMLFVMQISKRIRKYYGGLTTATQQISDYLKDSVKEEGESIIENSTYQWFFGLGENGIKLINDINLIPKEQVRFVSRANIGQCYVKIGSSTALRVQIIADDQVRDVLASMKS